MGLLNLGALLLAHARRCGRGERVAQVPAHREPVEIRAMSVGFFLLDPWISIPGSTAEAETRLGLRATAGLDDSGCSSSCLSRIWYASVAADRVGNGRVTMAQAWKLLAQWAHRLEV